jgi:hypothetical protein
VSRSRSDRGPTLTRLTVEAEGFAGSRADLRVVAAEPLPSAPRRGRLTRGRVRSLMLVDLVAVQLALVGMYLLAELIGPPAFIAPTWVIVLLWAGVSAAWPVAFATYKLYEGETRAIDQDVGRSGDEEFGRQKLVRDKRRLVHD